MNDFKQIGVAGDWHANQNWAHVALARFAEAGIKHILHLGDFGFWPGQKGQKYVYQINKWLEDNEQTLYITLGNHEDYVQLLTYEPHPVMKGWIYSPHEPNILVAERGTRWVWENVSFVSLGGANSIDFTGRQEWVTWWKAERISLADVYATTAGGHADVMIAHDCPTGVPLFTAEQDVNSMWSEIEKKYAAESREALRAVVDEVKPELYLHGHYHFFADHKVKLNDGVNDYLFHSIGLNMDTSKENLAILNLPDKTLEILPISWTSVAVHYRN